MSGVLGYLRRLNPAFSSDGYLQCTAIFTTSRRRYVFRALRHAAADAHAGRRNAHGNHVLLLAGFAKGQTLGVTALAFNYDDKYFFVLAVVAWLVSWRVIGALLRDSPTASTLLIVSAMGSAAIVYPNRHIRPELPDMNWGQYARRIESGETVDVPIYPAPWVHIRVAGRRKVSAGANAIFGNGFE